MDTKIITNTQPEPPKKTGYQVPDWWYDIRGFFIFKLCYQASLISLIRFFTKNLSDKHLEVAVGSGSFLDLCLKWNWLSRGKQAAGTAYDYTPEMLVGAKRKLKNNKNWVVELADVTKMPYKDGAYSTVNVANAFHCFPDPVLAAKELYRVLSVDGSMALNIVTPPRGIKPLRKIAAAIVRWGQKNSIIVAPISYEDSHKILRDAGFVVVKENWQGNDLRLLVKKLVN